MNAKRPYKHILKNLLHEQAGEILPLLLPGFQVTQVLDIEMPELKTTLVERPPNDFDRGIVGLALPGATVTGVYRTEWIEHSGKFERAYRVHVQKDGETDKPCYLIFEMQLEREDENLPRQLLVTYARMLRYAREDVEQEAENVEDEDWSEDIEDKGAEEENDEDEDIERVASAREQSYYVYPYMICPFPESVPAHIRDESISFNFLRIKLWEKDAREFLNTHVSATYFLLPVMKNVDAALLGLAIEELALRFEHDDKELGRHLTGLHMMLQLSDMMPDEEKLATQEYLKRFEHLIKHDPDDE